MERSGEVAGVVLLRWSAVNHEELEVDKFGGEDLVRVHREAQEGLDLLLKNWVGLCEEG